MVRNHIRLFHVLGITNDLTGVINALLILSMLTRTFIVTFSYRNLVGSSKLLKETNLLRSFWLNLNLARIKLGSPGLC